MLVFAPVLTVNSEKALPVLLNPSTMLRSIILSGQWGLKKLVPRFFTESGVRTA